MTETWTVVEAVINGVTRRLFHCPTGDNGIHNIYADYLRVGVDEFWYASDYEPGGEVVIRVEFVRPNEKPK